MMVRKTNHRALLLTSVGGPASANVIKCFRETSFSHPIIGVDCDPLMIELSQADINYLIPRATELPDYIQRLNDIEWKHGVTMLYPQSDIEVFVCSYWRSVLPPTCLPKHETIEICQDKGKLYQFLKDKKFSVPDFRLPTKEDIRKLMLADHGSPNYGAGYGWKNWYPCWVRARRGAGGKHGFVAKTWRDFYHMVGFYPDVDWMLVKLLKGRDYSFTSLWKNGSLVTSVLKERLRWVYNRIGTTAVQRTVCNPDVEQYCYDVIKALEPNITGLMMVDLKEDKETGQFYITEINAGRLGTVNHWFAKASRKVYKDDHVNFPWLLWKIHHGEKIKPHRAFDALPIGTYYYRHIDMGDKLVLP